MEELNYVLYKSADDEYDYICYIPFFDLGSPESWVELHDIQKDLVDKGYVITSCKAPYIHCTLATIGDK